MADHWDPGAYDRNARFVSDLGAPVLELLAPRPGERILDLGCGDGPLTEKIAADGAQVVGVDASPNQVKAARARGLDARVMSGDALTFEDEFDAVFSNAALHWMTAADEVIAGVRRALRDRGRFVGEFGGAGNVAHIQAALHRRLGERGVDAAAVDPWYFPGTTEYGAKLAAGGFEVMRIELIPRPTPLPGDMRDWLAIFSQAFTDALPDGDVEGFVAEVIDDVRPHLCGEDGNWTADYVRLRFAAIRR